MISRKIIKLSLIYSLTCFSTEYVMAKTQSLENNDSLNHLETSIDGAKAISAKLSPHEETMKSLLLTHGEKSAVLKNIDKVLAQKNKAIFEYMKLTKSLSSKVEELTLSQKIKGEFQKRELSGNIEDHDQTISDLKGIIVQKDLRIQYLKKSMKNQNIQLSQKIKKLNFKLKDLTNAFNEMPEKMEAMAILSQSKHIEEIRNLQNQLHIKNASILEYQKKIDMYENETELSSSSSLLANELKRSQDQLSKFKISYNELEKKYNDQVEENKQLRTYASNIKEEYTNHISILQDKYAAAINTNSKLDNSYDGKVNRMPASVVSYEPIPSSVDLGYLVEVDPRHLKLILDENFFFNSGQYEMTETTRTKLQSIIGAYSKEIFSKDELKDRLERIHIIGHSSPIYKGKYVDPIDADPKAFQDNMDISIQRAKSVARAITDNNFELPHRNEIRSKLVISGKSFSEPRMKPRGPASIQARECGIYDCESSQRVEIIFELQKKDSK